MLNAKLLKSIMVANGDDSYVTALSKVIGVNRVTAGQKLNGKSQFTQKEISAVMNHYNLTGDEIKEIFLN
jgi:hypothetical protein